MVWSFLSFLLTAGSENEVTDLYEEADDDDPFEAVRPKPTVMVK